MLKETIAQIQIATQQFNKIIDLKEQTYELLKFKLSKEEFELIAQIGEDIAIQEALLDNLHRDKRILNRAIRYNLNEKS